MNGKSQRTGSIRETTDVFRTPDPRCISIHPHTVVRCEKDSEHVRGNLADRMHAAQGCVWASPERRGR